MAGFAPEVLSLLRKWGAGGIPIGAGKVFWVDLPPNGDNSHVGTSPDQPFATITYALSKCVSGRNDYIMVLDDWQEPAAVAINKTRVHIIGLANYLRPSSSNPKVCLNSATNDFAIFTVSALSNDCEIAGFMLGGGAGHAGIENPGGTPMKLHIHDCVFGHSFSGNTPEDGIRIDLNATNIRIEHCTFLGTPGGKGLITRDGIRWTSGGDPLNGDIKNNQFKGLPGIAIDFIAVAAATGGITIKDNVFSCPNVASGEAITLLGNCQGFMVDGNSAFSGSGAAMGVRPYRDLGTNHWGLNLENGVGIQPILI